MTGWLAAGHADNEFGMDGEAEAADAMPVRKEQPTRISCGADKKSGQRIPGTFIGTRSSKVSPKSMLSWSLAAPGSPAALESTEVSLTPGRRLEPCFGVDIVLVRPVRTRAPNL